MNNIVDRLKFLSSHEWARVEADGSVLVGISHYGQDLLGDIVFVEFPEIGQELTLGDPFGEVEAVKTVSDLIAPINGIVVSINESLEDAPEQINEDPYSKGWLIEVKINDSSGKESLLSAEAYEKMIA